MEDIRLACAACGWTPGPVQTDPYPFRCPNAGKDDADHVVRMASRALEFGPTLSNNPFVRYRTSLYSYHVARSHGIPDSDYVAIVERLDAAVARVAGRGCRATPFARSDRLSAACGLDRSGGVWVKDETGNASGSHKVRHMIGLALYLEVVRHLGIDRDGARPLAVASCGNAALAAAVVARAIERKLLVFVPEHASPAIVRPLEGLGAVVTKCRRASESGDPCYLAFRRAVDEGALPFSCQGNENGLAIEGGMTLGYEIVEQMAGASWVGDGFALAGSLSSAGQDFSLASVDRVFIQTGGGALASACVQAFARCVGTGALAAMPRIHAVQTCGAYPLKRAYDRVAAHLLERLVQSSVGVPIAFAGDSDRASYLRRADSTLLAETFAYARSHRSAFMWPWETEPRSIAGGILDDETYDWAAVVEGMIASGGFPIVVDEATLKDANTRAHKATGIDVDHTGTAGLAGLLALSRTPDKPHAGERIVVLFTGVQR